MSVKCNICGFEKDYSIVEHLKYEHNMNSKEYRKLYPNSLVRSKEWSKNASKIMKDKWKDEDFRETIVQTRLITHNDPKFKKNMSEKIKKIHKESPEVFFAFTNWHKTEEFKKWVVSDERKLKISKTTKERWKNPKYRNKVIKSMIKSLNDGRCEKSEEFKLKMSEIISEKYANGELKNENNRYKTGKYKSITNEEFYYSSSYELKSMEFFDTSKKVKKWTNKHGIKIKYYHNNLLRNYIPDFFIELSDGKTYIIEMKGWETEEVIVKQQYAEKEYDNYKIFYSVNELEKFINENS